MSCFIWCVIGDEDSAQVFTSWGVESFPLCEYAKGGTQCVFLIAPLLQTVHLRKAWKSIRGTSAASGAPGGSQSEPIRTSSPLFHTVSNTLRGKLQADLSIDPQVECVGNTRTDHHYLLIYFWQIHCKKRMKHRTRWWFLERLWMREWRDVILGVYW